MEEEKTKSTAVDEERKREIREAVEIREAQLADDSQLDTLFEDYVSSLADDQLPKSKPQEHRMFAEWEDGLQDELQFWKSDLARLENQPTNKSLIFKGASDRIADLLRQAAKDINLLPDADDEATQMASQRSTRRKRSGKGSSRAHNRPYGASKNTATHPEQFKELALRLYDAGNNARQVAEELFDNDFGTRDGRMIGAQQMAQMLKRWTAEPKHGKPRRTKSPGQTGSRAGQHRAQAKAKAHGLRGQGLTMAKIAGILNDDGYRTVKGYPYTQQNVWHLLNREE